MTAKRFKKLLMSYGYSRNSANNIASRIPDFEASYSGYFYSHKPMFEVNLALYRTKHAWSNVCNTMQATAEAVDNFYRSYIL